MDHRVLRYVVQMAIAYIQHNVVSNSELPKLVEILGQAVAKVHDAEQKSYQPKQVADRMSQDANGFMAGVENYQHAKFSGRLTDYGNDFGPNLSTRTGEQSAPPATEMELARHIGLLKKIPSERGGLGPSEGDFF